MELTKKDKKHIEERVRKLSFRIVEESKEYMRLYEKTYLEEVIKMCERKIYTTGGLAASHTRNGILTNSYS